MKFLTLTENGLEEVEPGITKELISLNDNLSLELRILPGSLLFSIPGRQTLNILENNIRKEIYSEEFYFTIAKYELKDSILEVEIEPRSNPGFTKKLTFILSPKET